MFIIDQIVVYPSHGVGKIERIETKTIGDNSIEFYIVRIISNNMTLMVPLKNAETLGLRTITDRANAEAILEELLAESTLTIHSGQNWNRRYREYSENLKSGDIAVIAQVFKALIVIGKEKELSFGEKRLLEQSSDLICAELAYALDEEGIHVKKTLADFVEKTLIKNSKEK